MTDDELIGLYFDRSQEAVDQTRNQYGAWCRAIVSRLLPDQRDVEECLNDCWLQVWNVIPPTRPEHFQGWLGAVVRNRALAIRRKRVREPDTVDETALELGQALPWQDGPDIELEARELGEAISRFLHAQKEEVRIAFVRRYWYADSVEETAARMGWSVSKTKSVLFRTRNKLKEFLVKEGFMRASRVPAGNDGAS